MLLAGGDGVIKIPANRSPAASPPGGSPPKNRDEIDDGGDGGDESLSLRVRDGAFTQNDMQNKKHIVTDAITPIAPSPPEDVEIIVNENGKKIPFLHGCDRPLPRE